MASTTRGQRYRQIVTVLVDEGFGTLLDQLGMRAPWVAAISRRGPKHAEEGYTPEQRVRRAIERLGPSYGKIGQMLSVRPDLIPPSYANELARLQDNMASFSFEEARAEIEASFGQSIEELYAEFDPTPTAAATIGQVHMAVLHDGTRVAVKVQRPDIHDVIDADLDIMRTQARRIQGRTDIGVRYDVVGLVDEFSRVLREECDYLHEAENAEKLRANFADDDTVYFPAIYWDLTSSTVLTMERIDGVPFSHMEDFDAAGVDRVDIARRGITAYYEMIFIHGFYHADPHPGNLFAMPDGRVAFTDFGRCGTLTPQAKALVADLLVAIIEQDGDTAAHILMDVSRGRADVDMTGLKRDVSALIGKYYNLKLHEVDTRELIVEIMSLIGRRGLTLSSEFALLLTTLATIQALGTAIDPHFHFVESVQPFARRIVEEQLKPQAVARNALGSLRRAMRAMEGFPDNINRAVKRVGDGDLRMTVRPGGYDPLMARIEQAVDRLAFAVVVSAFVIGFSWLLARTEIPWWVEWIADFALVCAAGVGIWFFVSMLLRRFRQRRQD